LTDISNVGRYGSQSPDRNIASEATMQAILSALNNGATPNANANAGGDGGASGGGTQGLVGGALNKVGNGLKNVASSTINLAKELAVGGNRISDFASAAFGAQGTIAMLTRYMDDQVDTLRMLTSSGGAFNNSLQDMLMASVNSSMQLSDFQNMVRTNTEGLAAFGGTVTTGAKSFGKFSKDFRLGAGSNLLKMGLTVNDINDSLLSYAEIERRRTGENLRNDTATQNSALRYSKTIEGLTKITGLQRDQIEESMKKEMTDAGIRSQQSRLSGTALDNFRANLALIDKKIGGETAAGMKDLMDGVAQTDAGAALASQLSSGFQEMLKGVYAGSVSQEEFINQMKTNYGPELNKIAASRKKAELDAIRTTGGVPGSIATILDEAFVFSDLVATSADAALTEGEQRGKVTAELYEFENAVTELRTGAIKAVSDTLTKPGGVVDGLSEMNAVLNDKFGEGANSIKKALDDGISSLGEFALSMMAPGGGLTDVIKSVTDTLDQLPDNITNIFGEDGLLSKAIDNITLKFEGIGAMIAAGIQTGIQNYFGGFAGSSLGPGGLKDSIAAFNAGDLNSSGDRQDLIQTIRKESARIQGREMTRTELLDNAFRDLLNFDSLLYDDDQLAKAIESFETLKARQGPVPRNIGTLRATGRTTEAADVTANIHKGERVLNPQEAAAYNSQTGAGGTIQQLNTTMNQAVSLLQTIAMYQGQTAKSVAGIGTDYYRGINT